MFTQNVTYVFAPPYLFMSLFTKEMSSALAQKVRDNYEELFPQSKEAAFSRRSQSAWANITSEINAEFGSSISEKQCKEKWHNLKKTAKRENADEQKHRRGTGGGPKRLESKDPALQIITDTMGESASFKGIPGGRSSVKTDEAYSDVSTPTSVEKEEDEDLTPRAKKIPRWEKSGYEKAFPVPSVADLQRNVLELSVENQKKMSDSLDSFNSLMYFANSLMKNMNSYYERKLSRTQPPTISTFHVINIQINDLFNITQRTVSLVVQRVTKALANKSADFIKFPNSQQNEITIKRDFLNYCDLPFVMGAIDCSHIKIEGPGSDEESYINRKGFYSLNMQAVCDMRCKFTNIDLRWPGSTHDSFVLRQSDVWEYFESGLSGNSILLGDSGYPLKKWLMVPFRDPKTVAEKRFNTALCKGRSVIEHAFGIFKRRFSIAKTSCRLKLRRIATTILAATVLHNIAIEMRLPEPPATEEPNENDDLNEINEDENRNVFLNDRQARQAGIQKRQELVARFT
ncbi:hypothetical protein niasHT_026834 [Heterodera trifolii]|uniref:Putative nuclease HARBI1 n=1 Tax=Heterodera trifolii TaxID=157864 RepID=A0ABD2K4I8_9BILA